MELETLKSKERSLVSQLESVRHEIAMATINQEIELLAEYVDDLNVMHQNRVLEKHCPELCDDLRSIMGRLDRAISNIKEEYEIEN